MVWNNQQRPIGSAPLPEVHAYTQNKPKFDGGLSKTHPQGNSKKGKKQCRRNKKSQTRVSNNGKNISKHRNDKPVCQKCGCYSHITKKCHTPKSSC